MANENKEAPKKERRPSALKRDLQAAKRNTRNRAMKSRVNTAVRNFEESLKSGDASMAKTRLNEAYSVLDKAAQKGILKKNKTDRTKARLSARVSA